MLGTVVGTGDSAGFATEDAVGGVDLDVMKQRELLRREGVANPPGQDGAAGRNRAASNNLVRLIEREGDGLMALLLSVSPPCTSM